MKKTKLTSEDIRRYAFMEGVRMWNHWHKASLENPHNDFIREELKQCEDILEQITEYVF